MASEAEKRLLQTLEQNERPPEYRVLRQTTAAEDAAIARAEEKAEAREARRRLLATLEQNERQPSPYSTDASIWETGRTWGPSPAKTVKPKKSSGKKSGGKTNKKGSTNMSKCAHGRKKSGGCKRKPGPKRGSSNKNASRRGRKSHCAKRWVHKRVKGHLRWVKKCR